MPSPTETCSSRTFAQARHFPSNLKGCVGFLMGPFILSSPGSAPLLTGLHWSQRFPYEWVPKFGVDYCQVGRASPCFRPGLGHGGTMAIASAATISLFLPTTLPFLPQGFRPRFHLLPSSAGPAAHMCCLAQVLSHLYCLGIQHLCSGVFCGGLERCVAIPPGWRCSLWE